MPQLYCQLASRPNPWLLGRTSAGLCTLQTACPLTVTYSGGGSDTIAAATSATVYGGSAVAFDASADVWVVLTVPASGALQVVKEADLATVTGDWAGLARVVQHSTEPYQPQAYLAGGGLGSGGRAGSVAIASDTTALTRSLWNGSGNNAPPAGWDAPAYDDNAWPHAVITTDDSIVYVTGGHTVWSPSPVPLSTGTEAALLRHHVRLPAGAPTGGTLVLYVDYTLLACSLNGHALYAVPRSFPSPYLPITVAIPSTVLAGGADNVLGLWVINDGPMGSNPSQGGDFDYTLTLTYLGTGGVPTPTGPAEGDLLIYHGGAWTRLPVGTSAQELTVVSGDPAWATPPAGYTDPLSTKGDLLTRSASATVRLGVGSNGQVPTADSTAADGIKWATPAAGSVTSIDVAVPAPLSSAGGPITSSGAITLSWTSGQTANRVLASPNGSTGAVSLRALVGNDIPVDASTIVVGSGVIKGNYQAGSGVSISGNTISATGSGGSVTSVALSVPGIFSVSGSPVTTSGTLAVSLATQSAATVFAGPASGSAAAPTFRALQGSDLPPAAAAGGHIHAHGHFL